MSIHRAHVYACELTATELEWVQSQEKSNTPFGVTADTEELVSIHFVFSLFLLFFLFSEEMLRY